MCYTEQGSMRHLFLMRIRVMKCYEQESNEDP